VSFARFAAALLACGGWTMTAAIVTPWQATAQLRLSARDGYRSHLPGPKEFDSTVEESFAHKFGARRDGWHLRREGRILCQRQTAFVPDFVFRHDDGTEVLMEIVGFWTPEYLEEKRRTLRRFRRHRILLAVAARNVREDATIGPNVVVYKTKLLLKPVMDALEGIRNVRQPKATSGEVGPEEAEGRRAEAEAGDGRPLPPAQRQAEDPPGRRPARP
jgi:predicted nuclease of restriction endonuclease-like RecB superfamily